MQRLFCSYIKNGKERKKHSVLLSRTGKNARPLHSFEKNECPTLNLPQDWALRSFPFGTFRSVPFLKKNIQLFSIFYSSFWRLMRPKRMCHSFLKNGKERKECNVLLQRTEMNAKNAMFFYKERKRTQRSECSFTV